MKNNSQINNQLDSLDQERLELYRKSGILLPIALFFPLATAIIAALLVSDVTFFIALLMLGAAAVLYTTMIMLPFNDLKHRVREYLLQEFMKIYHPKIQYHYQPEKNIVEHIIRTSKLISCSRYHEEDVITGTTNNINFYISEIKLSDSSDNDSKTIFAGMLFKIKIPGRQFPDTQIQSKPGLLKKMFGRFVENRLFKFWYDTENNEKFEKELGPFLPFIRHLIQQQKDIRIRTEGDSITILMKSDMKFLDDPKPKLNRSFKDETYYQKIGQQINSLLFIVETFAGKMDKKDVIERLELKELEYRQLGLSDDEMRINE